MTSASPARLPARAPPQTDDTIALEASLGRCWAWSSKPACGALAPRWVRLPLASATGPQAARTSNEKETSPAQAAASRTPHGPAAPRPRTASHRQGVRGPHKRALPVRRSRRPALRRQRPPAAIAGVIWCAGAGRPYPAFPLHAEAGTGSSARLYLHSEFGHCATAPALRYFSIK